MSTDITIETKHTLRIGDTVLELTNTDLINLRAQIDIFLPRKEFIPFQPYTPPVNPLPIPEQPPYGPYGPWVTFSDRIPCERGRG